MSAAIAARRAGRPTRSTFTGDCPAAPNLAESIHIFMSKRPTNGNRGAATSMPGEVTLVAEHRRHGRVALLICVIGWSACSATSNAGAECSLEEEVQQRCGADARDCGRADDEGSRSAVDTCVVEALNGTGPFFAIYERAGTDSETAQAICRDGDGVVLRLDWDSDPSGGDRTGAVVTGTRCDGATAAEIDPDGGGGLPLACGRVTELGYVCQ